MRVSAWVLTSYQRHRVTLGKITNLDFSLKRKKKKKKKGKKSETE